MDRICPDLERFEVKFDRAARAAKRDAIQVPSEGAAHIFWHHWHPQSRGRSES